MLRFRPPQGLKAVGWLVDGYTFMYRRAITITEQSGSNLTDYQVRIDLDATNFDFSHFLNNGNDLRFTDAAGNVLPYWVELMDLVNQQATIWVKVPSIPANGSVDIYMYYGNDSAVSASNVDNTFLFGDDFKVSHPVAPDYLNFAQRPTIAISPNADANAWDGYIREKVTVLRENGIGEPIKIDGLYYAYYCGHDASGETTSQIGLATSPDMENWTKYEGNPVIPVDPLGKCQDPSVVKNPVTGEYYMYVEVADSYIVLYKSTDLINWSRYGVVKSSATSPVVWIEDGTFYLLYENMATVPESICLATSTDGINWVDDPNNPVISDPTVYCVPDSIIKVSGTYYLYGHKNTNPRRSRRWESTDLVTWINEVVVSPINFTAWSVFPYNGEVWSFAHWLEAYWGQVGSSNDRLLGGQWLFRGYGFQSTKWATYVNGNGGLVAQGDGWIYLCPNRGTISSCCVASNATFTNGFAVRVKKKYYATRYDAISIGYGNLVGITGATDWWFTTFENGYVWRECDGCTIECGIARMSGGVKTDLYTTCTIDRNDVENFNVWEFIYKSDGTLKVTVDGTVKAQATDTTYLSDPKYLLISKGEYLNVTGSPNFVAFAVVRKYTEPEPSVSVGGEEAA